MSDTVLRMIENCIVPIVFSLVLSVIAILLSNRWLSKDESTYSSNEPQSVLDIHMKMIERRYQDPEVQEKLIKEANYSIDQLSSILCENIISDIYICKSRDFEIQFIKVSYTDGDIIRQDELYKLWNYKIERKRNMKRAFEFDLESKIVWISLNFELLKIKQKPEFDCQIIPTTSDALNSQDQIRNKEAIQELKRIIGKHDIEGLIKVRRLYKSELILTIEYFSNDVLKKDSFHLDGYKAFFKKNMNTPLEINEIKYEVYLNTLKCKIVN